MKKRVVLLTVLALGLLLLVRVSMWPKKEPEMIPSPLSANNGETTPGPEAEKKLVQPLSASGSGVPPKDVPEENLLTMLTKAVFKPLHLYGLVLDTEGNPVAGALVSYSAGNKIINTDSVIGSTRGEAVSGLDGRFEIRERGMGISVSVSKEGYYQILGDDPRASSRGFYNGDNPGKSDELPPPASAPAVFVLRKRGNAVPLVQLPRRSVMVSRNGTPAEISLATGKTAPTGKGDLRVEAWTNDATPNAKGRYDWRCRITVPGGGLTQAKGNFAFEAPADGYEESVELGEKADQPRWLGDAERQFFVRLGDGRHARIKFRMVARGEHFFLIESVLNPEPGSRNVEAAPTPKPIAATPPAP